MNKDKLKIGAEEISPKIEVAKSPSFISRLTEGVRNSVNKIWKSTEVEGKIVKLSEEEEKEAQTAIMETENVLKKSYEQSKEEVKSLGNQYAQLASESMMESKYWDYDRVYKYVVEYYDKDLMVLKQMEDYMKRKNGEPGWQNIFSENLEFRKLTGEFKCGETQKTLLMAIFRGKEITVKLLFSADKLMNMEKVLRKKFILDLVNWDINTARFFIECLNQLPNKFVNSEQRADLLMEYAQKKLIKPELHAEEVEEFILREESKATPYR